MSAAHSRNVANEQDGIAGSSGRQRPARGPAYAFPSLTTGWRSQHSDNLVAVLNEALLQYDFSTAAGAAATLVLASDPARVGKWHASESHENRDTDVRCAHALLGGLEALLQGPRPPPLSRVQHFARRIKAHLGRADGAEAAQMELVSAMVQAGSLDEAFDVLCEQPERLLPVDARFKRAAMQGLLRHAQWAAAQRAVADEVAGSSGAERDWFAFDAAAAARAGRQTAEYRRDAIAKLREALALRPAATELSYILMQMLCASGQPAQAQAAAVAARTAAPADADAAALHALALRT
ncbi:hypothetical protein WJX81_001578 [Elliptochloris bilobata]|uniref:Uncharacterized protein n=1 Tax=Elliptochloris bilobata TaxID=381761 RepID=A0AAW1S5I6_9CHLO